MRPHRFPPSSFERLEPGERDIQIEIIPVQRINEAFEPSLANPGTLESHVRRVGTDNRMHVWEWLVSGDKLIKTDALDHSLAYDLVGCQDVAWDPVEPDRIAFMLPFLSRLHLGLLSHGAGALGEGQDAVRLRQDAERYAHNLRKRLSRSHWADPSQEQAEAPAS